MKNVLDGLLQLLSLLELVRIAMNNLIIYLLRAFRAFRAALDISPMSSLEYECLETTGSVLGMVCSIS